MLRRVTIIESGDANLLPGELVDRVVFETENRRVGLMLQSMRNQIHLLV